MTRMMSPDYAIEYMSKVMEELRMKKWSSCAELAETAKCLEKHAHMIPAESQATLKVTMSALFKVVEEICQGM